MKKNLALVLIFSIFLGFGFAQETGEAKSKDNGKYLGFIKDMKVGGFFNYEPAAGDLREFVSSTIGGGAAFEAGIPLPLFEETTFIHNVFDNFGASIKMTYDCGIMKDTSIDSIFNMRYMAGVYSRISLPGEMFSVVPEINYGITLNFPKASGEGAKYVKKVYVDQILQLGTGIRFSHQKMLDGKLEFDFTPTYSFSPEAGYSVHYVGFRFGAMYKFADKGNKPVKKESHTVITEKTEETEEIESVQLTPELVQKKDELRERAEILKLDFEELVEDAEENNLKKLAKKYNEYKKQVEEILNEIASVDSESSLMAAEEKLRHIESKIENLEEIEAEAELELDMAVTELAAKTGHAALIHHPDGSYTIAIPPLTFEANSTGLTISEDNRKSLDTLIEVLTTDERILNMTVSVYGYINPDSKSEVWTEEEKKLAVGRAEAVAKYLSGNGCSQKIDAHAGSGYTINAKFNRRVEFIVHS